MKINDLKRELESGDSDDNYEDSTEEDLSMAIMLLDQVKDLLKDTTLYFPLNRRGEMENCLVDIKEFLDDFDYETATV